MRTNVRLVNSDAKTAVANEAGIDRPGEEDANYDLAKEKTQHQAHCDEAGVLDEISVTRVRFEHCYVPSGQQRAQGSVWYSRHLPSVTAFCRAAA